VTRFQRRTQIGVELIGRIFHMLARGGRVSTPIEIHANLKLTAQNSELMQISKIIGDGIGRGFCLPSFTFLAGRAARAGALFGTITRRRLGVLCHLLRRALRGDGGSGSRCQAQCMRDHNECAEPQPQTRFPGDHS
jgi:hypothetical protein